MTPGSRALAARAALAERSAVEQAIAVVEQIALLDDLLNDLGYPSRASTEFLVPDGSIDPMQEGSELASVVHSRLAPETDLPPELDDLADLIEDVLAVDITFRPLPSGVDGLRWRRRA